MAKKKQKASSLDVAVDQLVDAVMDGVEAGYDNPLMPFDTFVEKSKLEAKLNAKDFRMRLRKGYLSILYAIRNKKGLSEEQKKEIVKNILSHQVNTLYGDYRIMP